jgi:hypothetical protein
MSSTGETREDFAGEERQFRIRLGEIGRIEAKCDTGIGEVCRRLARATLVIHRLGGNLVEALSHGVELYSSDVREPLYQGLIGAGMASHEATKLLRTEIDDRGMLGLLDNAGVALAVIIAVQKTPEPKPGETGAKPKRGTKPKSSTSPTSTASAPPSA